MNVRRALKRIACSIASGLALWGRISRCVWIIATLFHLWAKMCEISLASVKIISDLFHLVRMYPKHCSNRKISTHVWGKLYPPPWCDRSSGSHVPSARRLRPSINLDGSPRHWIWLSDLTSEYNSWRTCIVIGTPFNDDSASYVDRVDFVLLPIPSHWVGGNQVVSLVFLELYTGSLNWFFEAVVHQTITFFYFNEYRNS